MNLALDRSYNIGGKYWEYSEIADRIAGAVGVDCDKKDRWQSATISQLELRDRIQEQIEAYAFVHVGETTMDVVNKAIEYVLHVKGSNHEIT
jgi:hypothetical protein